jgi:2-polyprenyl-3-methyl-5-hydroxy-6-metoxy-1,4-benzoquinol methylase
VAYWDDISHHIDLDDNWMSHPLCRAAINRRVSGDANVWPVAGLARILEPRVPLGNVLSVGCGAGALERSLLDHGVARGVTGIDVSETVLEEARREAGGRGMAVRYVAAEARAFLREHPGTFDAVFFHQSLHHFDRLDELMSLVVGALANDGLLIADEYVGPSRNEWSAAKLWRANLAYRLLPRGTRRAKIVRAPINRDDPTEAIQSSQIVPAILRHFGLLHRHDYGGNLLALIYPNLRRTSPRLDEAVAELLEKEERVLRAGEPSFYSLIVCGAAALGGAGRLEAGVT